MGRTCFVPFCNSGYKTNNEKVSMFKAPKDKLEIWNTKILRSDRTLTEKDLVCEKHFAPEVIIKELKTDCYTIPLGKYKLDADAVPTIFPNCPKYISKYIKKRKLNVKNECIPIKKMKTENQDLENLIDEPFDTEMEYCSESSKNIYHILKTKKDNLSLPSSTWKLVHLDNVIAIYTLKFLFNNAIMEKKIVITEDKIELFIHENVCDVGKVFKKPIHSVKELEQFLNEFSKAKVCAGAFSFKNCPSNFDSKTYIKDNISQCWRYDSCSLIVFGNQNICGWCKKGDNTTSTFKNRARKRT